MSETNAPLILSAPAEAQPITDGPLRDGPDISWLPRVIPGDDQGQAGACVLAAIQNWAEVMYGNKISNEEMLSLHYKALDELGRLPDAGMSFVEGYAAARKAAWLPGSHGIEAVGDLSYLVDQPLLGGYQINEHWYNVGADGIIPDKPGDMLTNHAALICGDGRIDKNDGERYVYLEMAWRRQLGHGYMDWGWRGTGRLSHNHHRRTIKEIWRILI